MFIMYNVSSISLYIRNINSFNYNIIVQNIITVYIYIYVCILYVISMLYFSLCISMVCAPFLRVLSL